jgi:hypothetical protein
MWHPALGFKFPKLPDLHCRALKDGNVHVDDWVKFNQFKSYICGPTDDSNWVIKGKLLMGKYPQGKALAAEKRNTLLSDCVSAMLLLGISTFVCLMPEDEIARVDMKQVG